MEERTYRTLEFNKVVAQVAAYAAFSASRELLEAMRPTTDYDTALRLQQETTEGRFLLAENANVTVGGARDVRDAVLSAEREGRLTAMQLVTIRATLQSGIRLRRTIERSERDFILLREIAAELFEGHHIISAIGKSIDENGEVMDSASPKLAAIRRDIRSTQDKLRTRLNRLINNPRNQPYLQESLITTRNGRYVIPVKAEARGRLNGIVHDQSASGATLYIEPAETVEVNNKIRELELAERDEILRILQALSAEVGAEAQAIVATVEAIAYLDVIFARAKYASALSAEEPHLTPIEEGAVLRLYDARHPLITPEDVVAINLDMSDVMQLVITGPNTGGKTVTLKLAGLMIMMAQCGLHLPASDETTLSVFEGVYADIGDEQSIEQSLSTFSAHMTTIIRILDHADSRSLVILDELGSGTDPAEGAALARAILTYLRYSGAMTLTATHYPELKLYAHGTQGVRNASMEFDLNTLAPTYRLIVGLPGRSNALAIASRLGLQEAVLEEARGYVGEADLQVEEMLDEIQRTRAEVRDARERILLQEDELTERNRKLRARLERIEDERQKVLKEARQQAESELAEVRIELDKMRHKLARLSPSQREDAVEAVDEDIEAVEERIRQPIEPIVVPTRPKKQPPKEQVSAPGTLQVGDRVFVKTLQSEGQVMSVDEDEVEVQVGQLRARIAPKNLERRGSGRAEAEVEVDTDYKAPQPKSPGLELDMRGMRVEEGILALEEYLDRAYLSGLPWARILHGKGSGALRKAVREVLHGHELIKEYKGAPRHEGGEGVTLVYFAEMV